MPYDQLGDTPNVIVDGSANAHTTLTLSHWPHSGTPLDYRDDVSAQIAFRFLDRPRGYEPARVVSNNHFDEDGVVSVFALVEPDTAQARRSFLIDVASAGDLEVWSSRDALRVALTINAITEERGYDTAALYHEMLPRLVDMCDHVDRFRSHWETADAQTEAGLAALDDATITIDELPELDLAVVTIPERWATPVARRFDVATDRALTNDALVSAHPRVAGVAQRGRVAPARVSLRELGATAHPSSIATGRAPATRRRVELARVRRRGVARRPDRSDDSRAASAREHARRRGGAGGRRALPRDRRAGMEPLRLTARHRRPSTPSFSQSNVGYVRRSLPERSGLGGQMARTARTSAATAASSAGLRGGAMSTPVAMRPNQRSITAGSSS